MGGDIPTAKMAINMQLQMMRSEAGHATGLTGLQLLLVGFVRHLAHVDGHCCFDVCLSLFHPVMENLEELLRLVVAHHQFVEGVLQERGTFTLSPHLQQEEYRFAIMDCSGHNWTLYRPETISRINRGIR